MSWLFWQSAVLSFSHGVTSFALNWWLQSTFLIVVGLATARLLARRGAAVQFVVYSTTLTAVLVCPLLTWTLSAAGMTQWSFAVRLVSRADAGGQPSVAPNEIAGESPLLVSRIRATLEQRAQRIRLHSGAVPSAEWNPEDASPADAVAAAALEPTATHSDLTGPTPVEESQPPAPAPLASVPWLELAMVGVCLIWLFSSAWLLARLGVAWFRLAGIRRLAVPAESDTIQMCKDLSQQMGVTAPDVMHTPYLPSPCLAGIFDPAVLLPEADLPISLRDVLIHELAHLRRGDGHWNLVRKFATSIFWFQPLLWILSRRIEMSAEEVCDDFVVELGGDRAEYAHRLVDVAEFSVIPMATAGVAIVSLRSMLAQRVARIMDSSRRLSTRVSRGLVVGACLTGVLTTSIISILGAVPSTSDANDDQRSAIETVTPSIAARTPDLSLPVLNPPVEETQIAEAHVRQSSGGTVVPKSNSLPGLISSPSPLPGNRRWQMFTRNSGSSSENVAWSPDGRWLAIAGGQMVRLFDFQTGTPEFKVVLTGHRDTVKSVRFNVKGDRLATASLDGTVRLWDADGREQFVYGEHEDAVLDVSWHPSGDRLASASLDGTVRIWTNDGKTVSVHRDHEAPVNAVAWNPNGKLLASGCENKSIRYWTEAGAGPVIEAHLGPVRALAWNFDGSQLLSCDFGIEAVNDGDEDVAHMKIWDQTGSLVNSILINSPISHIAWSPDGKRAVAGGWRSIKLWTIGEPQVQSSFTPVLNGIVPVGWRPTGDMIAAGPMVMNGMGQPQEMMALRYVALNSAGLNVDGTVLGIGRANQSFALFTSDGEQKFLAPTQPGNAYSLMHAFAWSPDGKTFIPGTRYAANLQRYDVDGKAFGESIVLPTDTRSVAWSRDGKLVAAGGDRKVVALVDLETSKVTTLGQQKHGITKVCFTPDQQFVCSAGFDSCIRFWSLDGKPVKVLEAISAPIDSLAWAADGQLMATGHQDSTIRFWSGEGESLQVIGGHGNHVTALEFSPDGTLLASGSRDQSVRIWRRDGTPVAALQGHSGAVFGIQWTPDGRGIYTSADDGTIRLWNVETGMTVWQSLMGEGGGYVTLDAQGHVAHGDEKILESDFVFFAEDDQRRLKPTSWSEIRPAIPAASNARAN